MSLATRARRGTSGSCSARTPLSAPVRLTQGDFAIPADWITGSDGQARPANPAKGPVPILRYILR